MRLPRRLRKRKPARLVSTVTVNARGLSAKQIANAVNRRSLADAERQLIAAQGRAAGAHREYTEAVESYREATGEAAP